MPAAILFDFYGTLADPAAEDERAAAHARTAAALGVGVAAFAAVLAETWPQRVVGVFGDTAAVLGEVSRRLGLAADPARDAAAARVHREATTVLRRPHPAALGLLRDLRAAGRRLAVVSDCSIDMPETWAASPFAGLVDATVFSASEGFRKPDPRMYRTAASRLGVPVAECWFVGDGGSRELAGAEAVGATPVLVRNTRYPSAATHRLDVDPFVPELQVDDLDEVAGALLG